MSARHLLRVQEILGGKWDLLILWQLSRGPLRHKELSTGVREIDPNLNDGVLNKRLRALARDGLIRKQPDGKRHVHVLTDLGQEIVAVLSRIADLQDAAEPPDQTDEPPAAPGRSTP